MFTVFLPHLTRERVQELPLGRDTDSSVSHTFHPRAPRRETYMLQCFSHTLTRELLPIAQKIHKALQCFHQLTSRTRLIDILPWRGGRSGCGRPISPHVKGARRVSHISVTTFSYHIAPFGPLCLVGKQITNQS